MDKIKALYERRAKNASNAVESLLKRAEDHIKYRHIDCRGELKATIASLQMILDAIDKAELELAHYYTVISDIEMEQERTDPVFWAQSQYDCGKSMQDIEQGLADKWDMGFGEIADVLSDLSLKEVDDDTVWHWR